jgi:hypothetical protein
MVTVSTRNPKQHGLSPHGWSTGDSGHAREKKTGGKQASKPLKNTTGHKMHLFDLQYAAAVVCLIFSVPALVRVLNKEEALMCGVLVVGCTSRRNRARFAQLISARDCFRYSEPEIASYRESADFTDPCFLLCSLSPRAIGRFFLQRKR